MGFFPTLDIRSFLLPDMTEQPAAYAFFARRATRHHTARGGQDVDPKPAKHARDVLASDVDAAAWARHPLDPRNGGKIRRSVFQIEPDGPHRALLRQLVIHDEAL